MTYEAVACVLVEQVDTRYERILLWDGTCGTSTVHSAREPITKEQWDAREYRYPWPDVTCERCGAVPEPEIETPCSCGEEGCTTSSWKWSAGERAVWNTPSGKLEPGSMYLRPHYHDKDGVDTGCFYWDNCDGQHLMVICPNGMPWDVDSRASNCGLPDDKVHRCWVREGVPPNVSVSKGGVTCAAGAGSIQCGDYHGFLTAGGLTAG